MSRVISLAAALGIVLAVAVPGAAQDSLAKRVSLDLKAMAPAEAFKVIGDAVGLSVDVAADVTTPVDIVVRNVTARTALNTICESIDCTWKLTGSAIAIRAKAGVALAIKRGERADKTIEFKSLKREHLLKISLNTHKLLGNMVFKNAPLAEVADRLSKASGVEVTISGDIAPDQTISADLSDKPLWSALSELTRQLGGNMVCRVRSARMDRASGEGVISVQFAIQIAKRAEKVRK